MSAEPIAFFNGEFLPYSQAKLSLHDAGFVFGATVTDFCRTFRHQLFRWPDHLARFRSDCSACFIPLSYSDEQLTSAANELIAHNATLAGLDHELALISFATPGEIGYFVGQPGGAGESFPTIGMHTIVLNRQRYRRFFEQGIDLFSFVYEPPECEFYPLLRAKHRSRIHWWIADQTIKNEPASPIGAIPVRKGKGIDSDFYDTTIGTLLLVTDGVVRSANPSLILNSISLRVIEELCESLSIRFLPMNMTLEPYHTAQEAMLTGSAFCLAPVRSIRGYEGEVCQFNPPGPIFERLLKAFSDLVGVDIRADFLRFP